MGNLADEFVKLLRALKAQDDALANAAGAKVMKFYLAHDDANADNVDKAVALIINKTDAEGGLEGVAVLVLD